ncbi:glycosyl hydrolase [Aspergillus crustosus]
MPPPKSTLISLLAIGCALAQPTRILDLNFPDPAVIQTDQGYYALGTQSNGINVQVARSDDADDGTYVLYFFGLASADTSKHCVGTATSPSIEGPYIPNEEPFACHLEQGGAIDAAGFREDDGSRYVLYKIDGNSLNGDGSTHPTPILLQKVLPDGITRDGDPIQILDRDEADGPLIESPSLIHRDGTYYPTFSSNMYHTLAYDVSYATASSLTGPYTKVQAPDAPLLVSGDASDVGPLAGPGHADLFDDGSRLVFHAFQDGGSIDSGRAVWIVDVEVVDGRIRLL